MIGRTVSRYRIIEKLGEGGMGVVYKAQDTEFNRPVALKVLSADLLRNEEVRTRFRREASSTQALVHPNIVSVFEVGEDGDSLFYVMEFIDGPSLDTVLRNHGQLTVTAALQVARAVADALEHAHAHGVLHRDLKPGNVLIPNGQLDQAKLTDFGVVGLIEPASGLTRTGQMFGTPLYMSPEQVLGERQSAATDIYGLGILLYQMLYGAVPFAGDNTTVILYEILKEEISLPDSPPVPTALRAYLSRSLSKDASERPKQPLTELGQLLPVSSEDSNLPSSAEETIQRTTRGTPDQLKGDHSRPSRLPLVHRPGAIFALFGVVAAAVAGFLFFLGPASPPSRALVGITIGLAIGIGGVGAGYGLRRWLRHVRSEIDVKAEKILTGSTERFSLTKTLAVEVDELLARCRTIDQRFLGKSIALMVDEYRQSKESDDRRGALLAAVDMVEKLNRQLSPWYVRHEKLLTLLISVVGILSGVVKIVETIVKMGDGG